MGRVSTPVIIQNLQNPSQELKLDLFVDTGAAYLTLPAAWKGKLGRLKKFGIVNTEFANQKKGQAEIYGPVRLRIDGFRDVDTEVLFLEMEPDDKGGYEALLGYIPLEQINAAVDMETHKLIPLKYVDLK